MSLSQSLLRGNPALPRDIRVSIQDRLAAEKMAQFLSRQLLDLDPHRRRQVVLLAIGTDRSTGDSLGPLVGSRVCELAPHLLPVFGTLDEPVHAVNLRDRLKELQRRFPVKPLVIAVDASLGQIQHIGSISLGRGPLHPGTGVHKDLPQVGEIFISGVVNLGGFLEYIVLQNTRLSLVMKMADCIARALVAAIREILQDNGTSRRS